MTVANTQPRRRPFKVAIGVDEHGVHTVFSETEPVFCFLRKTEKEAKAIAEETVRDYIARFGQPMELAAALPTEVRLHQFRRTREIEIEAA